MEAPNDPEMMPRRALWRWLSATTTAIAGVPRQERLPQAGTGTEDGQAQVAGSGCVVLRVSAGRLEPIEFQYGLVSGTVHQSRATRTTNPLCDRASAIGTVSRRTDRSRPSPRKRGPGLRSTAQCEWSTTSGLIDT